MKWDRFFNNRVVAVILAVNIALLSGCGKQISFVEATDVDKNVAPLISANTNFAFKLFDKVRQQDNNNLIISPYGISTMLAMLRNGASEHTLSDLDRVAGFQGLTLDATNRKNNGLMSELVSENPNSTVQIAGSVWMHEGIVSKISQPFLNNLKNYFNAAARIEDFGDPATLSKVNSWASENTHGHIPEILKKLSPYDVMVLLNAVYFKANWEQQFEKEKTREQPFVLASGEEIQVPMMHQSGNYKYFSDQNLQFLELPYKDADYSLFILLPQRNKAIAEILSKLDEESWAKLRSRLISQEGDIAIPKFKFDNNIELNAVLSDLGMASAFHPGGANFSRLSETYRLSIGRFFQVAKVELDEEGTTAAAVTVVTMQAEGMASLPFAFRADHPFFFSIVHNKTGAILFMGIVQNPQG